MKETIKGVIKTILPVEQGVSKSSGNEWQKQTFVVSNNEGYEGKEQIFAFEVFGADKVDNLTKYNKEGDFVEVNFNISTNEYKGKYYTSLQSWKVSKLQGTSSDSNETVEEDENDLPF